MSKRKKPLVIICGLAGSGKSTAATTIAKRFKLKHLSAGDHVRSLAKKLKMNLIEWGRYAEKHPNIDKEIDYSIMQRAKKGGFVLDGRTFAYLAKKMKIPAVKVFLNVDPNVSAVRVAKRDGISVATALKASRQREREIARRLRALYGLDTSSTAYYDAVIQTDRYAPHEVAELIASLVIYGN